MPPHLHQGLLHGLSEAIANGQASQLEHRRLHVSWQGAHLAQLVGCAVMHGGCLNDVVGYAGHILARIALEGRQTGRQWTAQVHQTGGVRDKEEAAG
jgi:hypothetical protein